ncbi:MAG: TldD/PmbA family protein [Elusimicrobiales bacterium]|nr:TldD/PmbA family protein [Elusimicrobiales bacterium]
MFDTLKAMLGRIGADYADVRHEVKKETVVGFNGKELTRVTTNSTDGFVMRALYKGGFSSVAFTRPEDAPKAAAALMENTRLLARTIKVPASLAKVAAAREYFRPEMSEDPSAVSLEEKIELARAYNAIPLKNPKVVSTNLAYTETSRDKHFVSTEGAEIREELVTVSFSGMATAKEGALTQSINFMIGGSDGFSTLRNREPLFNERTELLDRLLTAKPVTGGAYNVLLDHELGGVFTHEAFGHFSEGDIVENMPDLRKKMHLGAQLGSPAVSIVDDPTLPHQLGFYKYDDEGVPARRVELMRDGVLRGRLHSRRTAAAFGEPPTGHCVAEDYRFAPMVRMGTIMILPDPAMNLDRLLARLGDGLYLCGSKGGQTSGENFTFGAAYGFEVKGGKIAGMVRDINIMGNLFSTLKNIAAVGGDVHLSERGGCGKGQTNIRSCHGGPQVLINNAVVGGR